MTLQKVALLLATIVLGLVPTGHGAGPTILSKYGDTHVQFPSGDSAPRDPRDPVHTGVDIGGRYGHPVIATSDGMVFLAGSRDELCGIRVVIDHGLFESARFYTGYCHLAEWTVRHGQRVKRGEIIGFIGRTGLWNSYEHVHFDLQKIVPEKDVRWNFIDPLPFVIGCFDPERPYSTERLVLTWPIQC